MFTHEQLLMIRQALRAPSVGANYDTVEKFLELKLALERAIVTTPKPDAAPKLVEGEES